MEGEIFFFYMMQTPESQEHWSAILNVMHMNDCSRRIKLFKNISEEESVKGFEEQAVDLRQRLTNNPYFLSLPSKIQKGCLSGDYLMINSRDEMLEIMGKNKSHFNAMFDLLSQHTHILPLSFYRMERQGRGTGIENETDRDYIAACLSICTDAIVACTNKMAEAFPDTAPLRQGSLSKFSPGPKQNMKA